MIWLENVRSRFRFGIGATHHDDEILDLRVKLLYRKKSKNKKDEPTSVGLTFSLL